MNESNIKTNDNVIYNGHVHIQYWYGRETRHIDKHNDGLLPLFSSIVLALGDQTDKARSYFPRYIMAKNNAGSNCLTGKLLFQDRKYYNSTDTDTTLPVDGSEADTIRYTFVIPAANMIPNQLITSLHLINDNNDICAEITLEDSSIISTNIEANLLVYWDLTFTDAVV